MNDNQASASPPPPTVRQPPRWQFSLIWLVPLIAALVGLSLVVRAVLQAGPEIHIQFKSADGLEPGKTEVRYKDVVIGKVRQIDLTEDYSGVVVTVDLRKEASGLAVDDTRFWIVKPRIDLGGVSGLGTLLSGAYIGVDIGKSETERREFSGLENPPAVTRDRPGRRFLLRSNDLGSLNLGSPLYFRRLLAGRVVGYELSPDGRGVSVQVFIDAPYDKFVTTDSRFWNASGVDVSINAAGLKLNTQSMASVLIGGVAFQTPADSDPQLDQAAEDTVFDLYGDMASAMAPPDGKPLQVTMRFYQSMRGLTVGAPIDFQGLVLGDVTKIELNYDPARQVFAADVNANLYPLRIGKAFQAMRAQALADEGSNAWIFEQLIGQGLRAQLRTANLLTGQLYVALDFVAKAKPVQIEANGQETAGMLRIPTVPGSLEEIQTQIAEIVRKVGAIPFDEIGAELNSTLKNANALLEQINTETAPEMTRAILDARATMGTAQQALSADAPLQQDTRRTLESVDRAARSLRGLTETLQRHPQSLLRGKPDDPDPPLRPFEPALAPEQAAP